MQRRKSFFNNEMEQRFSLRKYTIGLCSVCLGFVTIGMGSQSVKADTVNNVEKSSVVRENKMQDTDSANTPDSAVAKPNTTPTETKESEAGSLAATAPKTNATSTGANANEATPTETKLDKANSTVANSNNALAQAKSTKAESIVQPKVNGTSTETKPNELGSAAVNPNAVSTEAKLNTADPASLAKIKPQKIRLAKLVNAKALAESKVATDNQFNFDDWTTQIDNTYLNIIGYKGDRSKQIVVPNGADFAKAGKNDKNLQVEIDKHTLADLIVDGVAPKLSNTDGQKIVAKDSDWFAAFWEKDLHDISGLANLDTSNVTNMREMFYGNQISDLSPLTNWDTSNVTDMDSMFDENQIRDLSPLSNWNTGKVTDMNSMFDENQIRDLSPLAGWNTGNVIYMNRMFYYNQIRDLSPLANWDTSKVTNMSVMFESNQISDLSPLANWNTGKVTNMHSMFSNNLISDLSPLANWNTSNVINMSYMFSNNMISDLSPLAGWNTANATNMDNMFYLDPLNVAINSQSILNKFHAAAYKLDNIRTLDSHSESKTFNDSSQILLDKNVITEKDSATLTFKANGLAGNTYQIKIYNPNNHIEIQAATLPTALGTTDTSYQNGYTIITNKFINNGSVKQDISITQYTPYPDRPNFAQYESTSGLITVIKDKENLGSINIAYQNVADISKSVSADYIGNKPYINHTQSTFYFQPRVDYAKNAQYSFIKSAGLTITVSDDVTIDPNTFIDIVNGKILQATKVAANQYQVVLNNTTDGIAVKGLINVPENKLANGTAHLSGFSAKYTINTYNDKMAPLVATDTSKELSVIPDLKSYHGNLININQSKWAFDRNGNEVDDYTSQGFTNEFDYDLLNSAISTQITNGVETLNIPTGVNITKFGLKFDNNVIDHIDYIYTDGSRQTASSFSAVPKAIRQMKVYFKNGIQSDVLSDIDPQNSNIKLSFDAAYPDGTPIKNFDTFNITGSFSCDELGSTGNVDIAQIMLVPTQTLTDGMLTDTNQDESNKAPNANGNSINAIIRNDGLPQHQGHLTNPIFYFKYNDLMVPDLSKISASYDNQNKELGSTGLTNIDNNKIHSSIITDDAGQKFIKVKVDGEYYYQADKKYSTGFNVKIPIINVPDALAATKDWSWYILNNSDEEKTKSTIQNLSQSNKLDPVTVDGNTLSVGGTGTWQIIVAEGFTSGTETQGNLNGGPGLASIQDDHHQDPTHFYIYDSIINATNDAKSNLVSVTNLPSTQDGKSEFNVHMTGKASLINVMTGQTYDATITYSYRTGDNNFITGDQVTDWSKVKSIKVVPNGGAPSITSLRLVVPVEDKTVYDDVGKTIYMSTMTYGEDKTNTNYTIKDGFAVPEKSTILPIIIKAGDKASAKLTVQGQATVHTLIHYKDANGKDVYVKLADQDKTYKELQDTMKRSDYLQSDSNLTIADRGLLPTGMVINYDNPTIRNSNNTYAAGYANNVAAFDKTAKYDFDGDQVIFEGAMPEIVTKTHQVKETIHYVYRDGSPAKPDKVLTSITLKQTGYKNPFTGKITWDSSTTDTLNSVDSPEITGYIADKLTVPSYLVTIDSPDKEVIVTYDADNETADFTYFDDTTNSTLKVVNKSGKSNTSIGYTTTDEINNYEKQGYTLVSDDTNGRSLNFNNLPTVDQHYTIHLKHKTESVTRNGTVTRIIHYLYDNGNTAQPDKTQTVSFNETGTKDDVTGKTAWNNDSTQTVDSVNTPSIVGYTPDKSSIEGQSFKFGDKDVEVTVTYHANTQKAKITYIDDTTKIDLDSQDANGKFGQTITFETAPTAEIENYKKQGYKLVSNDFNDNKYQADDSKNVFYVHFVHDTKKVSRNDDVNMTVHYVMDDGSVAPSDNKQTVNFTENGIQDLVTKKIDWTPAVSQTFKDVATKSIVGYTPDKENVAGQTVNFGDPDINVTVTYHANAQTATITYIDDTTKTNLDSKDASGKFGQAITFATAPSDEIANYKKQGYKLVSNDFNDNKYQADDSKNVFYVHFAHDTKKVSRNDDVNMTVHYVMDDGSEAPSDSKQTVSFTENGIQDLVTQKINWTPAVSQTFKDVATKSIVGYTPDKENVTGQTVNFGDKDINVTVHYSANTQTATITYIDDTEKKTLSSDNQNGKFNQTITFEHDPAEVIKGFEEKGYVFVSNTFDNQKYQADNSNNVFEVHLKHGTKNVSRSDDVNMTVHYVMDDNSEAPSDNKQTLGFTENGIQDLVTKHIDWTPAASQTFKDVVTPKVAGYTPDQDKVTGPIVNFGDKDIEATVRYSPNVQLGHINYIDDNTGKTLTRDDFSGRTNEHEDYTSTDRIQEFENKGYVFVSSDYPDGGFNFDNNDQQDQIFNVHLKHGTVTVTSKKPQIPNTPIDPDPHSPKYPEDIGNTNSDVKRTIDYKFKDGKTAQPTVKDNLHFERTVVIDKVTGDVLSDTWTPSQNFSDIQTPAIQGYTPDRTAVSDKNISHDHQDIIEHVVYSPDVQHMTITYIDDTTGKTLHTDNPTGVSDQDAKYTTSDTIKKYEDQHYKLVSDSTKGQDLVFDHNDNADQTYEVHFVHGKHAIDQTTSPKQTIHYVYADGLVRQGKAADDNVQQLSFKRDGYNDEVTGIDHWNAWTPANSQYKAVDSPVIQGYTPDKSSVDGSIVNPTDKDIEVTVTYSPNVQLGHINYIDDNTGKTLARDNFSGKTNEHEDYTPSDRIQEFENKGYELVSNDYPAGGFNFDANDQQEQVFNVHLKHGIVTVTTKKPQKPNMPIDPDPQSPKYPKDISNTNSDVKRTIDYKFKDDKTAQPTVNDSLHFERTVVIDKVTGDVLSDTWTPSQDFNDVQTPVIQGYTPDRTVVSDTNIGHDHQNIVEHVIYNPDAQHMTITYIDDTTGKTLKQDNLDGTSDQDAKYTTANRIKHYTDLHYKLVSDSTNGQDLIFDHDDNVDPTYEVHFVHGRHTINQTTSPKQTIHYVYADDLARQGKAADDNVQQLSFKRDGYNDEVTGVDHWNAWTPANSNYNAVDSPVIQGYTPDKSVIEKSTVNPTDKDTEITVVYNADEQAAHVIYVDKTTNDTLTSNNLSGKSDKDSGYNTKDTIEKYQSQHYVLTEDETNGKNVIFDHDDKRDQTYYVYFVHGTQKVSREHSASFTVHYIYKDGRQAKPDHEQALSFTENGIQDLVTQKITWTPADSQKFDDVVTPVITGYTPDQDKVAGQTANFETGDRKVTVTYLPDVQLGHINYIDDNTGKTLTRDNFSGRTNEHEDYTPIDRIQEFENKGYELVSNDYPDGGFNFDDNDQQDQVFNVHLKHGTTTVTPDNPGHPGEPVDPKNPEGPKYPNGTELDQVKRTGTQTIHYVGAGDKTPADNKQTFIFTREITFDNVTREIISKTPWNVKSHTFGNVDTPVIPGYHTDTAVAGGATVTPDDLNKVIIVTYAPDGGSGDNPGSNGGGDQGTTSTPEPVPEPTPSPDDQPDTTLPSDNNTNKDVEKDKQDKPEEVKKARKIIKIRITKQEHIGNAEKAEHLTEQEHNDQTVVSPVKNEANEPQLPQTGEANTSVIGLLGMLVAGFAAILGFESSRSRKHKN